MKNSVNLDLMRSIAVLCVVGAHSVGFMGFPAKYAGWSGISGVCLFFVHTSLVLMFSLERDASVGHFYIRRIFRIYPLWIVMVVVVLLFRLPQFQPAFVFHRPNLRGLVANLMLTFNLDPFQEVVGAGWSLPIEVDMYIFLPMIFYFARTLRSIWPVLLLNVFAMVYARSALPALSSALPMCVPYFLPGVLAYVLWKKSKIKVVPSWMFPMFLLGVLAVDHFYGSFRASWFFCLAIGLALPCFREMDWKPVRVGAHYVAKYSYGIYLTHISALVVYAHVLKAYPLWVRIGAFLALLVISPVLLYHLVEEPMIRLGAKIARRSDGRAVPKVTDQTLMMEPAP